MGDCCTGYYDKRSVTGRKLPKIVSKAALRRRAQELVRIRQEQSITPEAVETRLEALKGQHKQPEFSLFFDTGSWYVQQFSAAAPVPGAIPFSN
jgi:hypothetical protein